MASKHGKEEKKRIWKMVQKEQQKAQLTATVQPHPCNIGPILLSFGREEPARREEEYDDSDTMYQRGRRSMGNDQLEKKGKDERKEEEEDEDKWKKWNEKRKRNKTGFKEETSTDGDSKLDSSEEEDKNDDWKIKGANRENRKA